MITVITATIYNRYCSKVIKLINNPDVTHATFHWLKLVRLCVALKMSQLVLSDSKNFTITIVVVKLSR